MRASGGGRVARERVRTGQAHPGDRRSSPEADVDTDVAAVFSSTGLDVRAFVHSP